ncbi:Uncharacterised protein [Bordetella pertussis]|nr:Uncharacterised protein [Bordetella pertussis]
MQQAQPQLLEMARRPAPLGPRRRGMQRHPARMAAVRLHLRRRPQAVIGAGLRQPQLLATEIADLEQLHEAAPGNRHMRVVIEIVRLVRMQRVGPAHMHLGRAIVAGQHLAGLLLGQRWADIQAREPVAQAVDIVAEDADFAAVRGQVAGHVHHQQRVAQPWRHQQRHTACAGQAAQRGRLVVGGHIGSRFSHVLYRPSQRLPDKI